MKKRFLETGKITNTHGVRGEVRLQPWADAPDSILGIKRLFIDERLYKVSRARVQGGTVILKLDGVDDINSAMLLKNKIVFLDRCDVKLEDGAWFIQDAIGLPVFDETSGSEIGVLEEIMDYPAGRLYSVRGEKQHLIPEKGGFIRSVDIDGGRITVRLIEGM